MNSTRYAKPTGQNSKFLTSQLVAGDSILARDPYLPKSAGGKRVEPQDDPQHDMTCRHRRAGHLADVPIQTHEFPDLGYPRYFTRYWYWHFCRRLLWSFFTWNCRFPCSSSKAEEACVWFRPMKSSCLRWRASTSISLAWSVPLTSLAIIGNNFGKLSITCSALIYRHQLRWLSSVSRWIA